MRIYNLDGIYTGDGFKLQQGRRVRETDIGFLRGPLDIVIAPDGAIASIEKTAKAPPNEESFDGTGLVVTAGYVDSHTHSLFLGSRAPEYFDRWAGLGYREIAERGGGIINTVAATGAASEGALHDALAANLAASLACGVTTVEVKTGYGLTPETELRILRVLKAFSLSPIAKRLPRTFATFLGLHALPKGEDERAYVDAMIRLLPTIVSEELAAFVDAFPEKGFFSLVESLRFTDAGEKAGLKVRVHADELSDLGTSEAYAARGALSVDHLQKINAKGVAALASARTVATLLPATSFYLGLEYADARRLCDAGARVALATDFNPGTAPSPSMPFTLMLAASQMKMTVAEIFCAATYNGAAALGLDAHCGLVMNGYRADLNLYKLQPARDSVAGLSEIVISSLKPRATLLGGRLVNLS